MVERLASSLKEYGVYVDVLCMDNLHLVKQSDVRFNRAVQLLLSCFNGHNNLLIRRVVKKAFTSGMLKGMLKNYDLVDFHAFSSDYLPYMTFCESRKILYDITLWGSDIMRATERGLDQKRMGFENCRHIKCSENLHQVLKEKYSSEFDNKVRIVYFGNSDYEIIDRVSESDVLDFKKSLMKNRGTLLVTCGYNGSEGQNHAAIIEAIQGLPEELKCSTFFLFPMTYGASPEYLERIRLALDGTEVHYTIIDQYISAERIATLRRASDIVINIQKTDAFSGSLQDHLYCGNVLIVGEWLNYVPLENAEVYYIKTSVPDIRENLIRVLADYPKYKGLCSDNRKKMENLTSWASVLPSWVESYLS